MAHYPLTTQQIDDYQRHGVVLLPGLLRPYLTQIRQGIAHNMREPGEFAAENTQSHDSGRFFDDYCNWQRIPQFVEIINQSACAQVAAELMGSSRVQIFHDHVLVKEPGTSKATPWHQDSPYYFIDGEQTISFWCPADDVDDATLRCVKGSQNWQKAVLPTRWLGNDDFYPDPSKYMPVPDPDAEGMPIAEWPMQAGDVVAFHFKTLHGARANMAARRRRAFSLRFIGDDARYSERPGPTSPPFHGHEMRQGEKLRTDWFPYIETAQS